MPPLILTLKLDQQAFGYFDGLRRQHFPPERNFIPAHVSLFHALPGDQEEEIREALQATCAETPGMRMFFDQVRMLGKGVAIEIHSPRLMQLHDALAAQWQTWLSQQDLQPFRPHITIQNKVTPEAAKALHAQLANSWRPVPARGEGLLLWRYLGGPWEGVDEFAFMGG